MERKKLLSYFLKSFIIFMKVIVSIIVGILTAFAVTYTTLLISSSIIIGGFVAIAMFVWLNAKQND